VIARMIVTMFKQRDIRLNGPMNSWQGKVAMLVKLNRIEG
jgi:hypothetical protein